MAKPGHLPLHFQLTLSLCQASHHHSSSSTFHPISSSGSFCPQATDPAFSPSTDHRTASSPPTRERAEPFPISSDPRLPLQPAGLSFLSRREYRPAAALLPPAAPTEAAPFPTENRRPDLQPAENNEPREREKPEEIRSKKGGRTETLLAFFSSLQVKLLLTASAEGKRRQSSRIHQLFGVARDGAWTHAPPLFLQFQNCSSAIPGFFRGYFVNLKLCNVIFI